MSKSIIGIIYANLAIFLFAVADVGLKWLAGDYSIWQISLMRGLISLIPLAWFIWRNGGVKVLRTKQLFSHLIRGSIGIVGLFSFGKAMQDLSLSDAYAIIFSLPLMVAVLSAPILKEQVSKARWVSILIGFIGVILILRPEGGGLNGVAALMCLLGVATSAISDVMTRKLCFQEHIAANVFYYNLAYILVGLAFAPAEWVAPKQADWIWFIIFGLASGGAFIALTEALARAKAALIASFQYVGMLWAALFGFLLWGDQINPAVMMGAAVIMVSGLFVIYQEHRQYQAEHAEMQAHRKNRVLALRAVEILNPLQDEDTVISKDASKLAVSEDKAASNAIALATDKA